MFNTFLIIIPLFLIILLSAILQKFRNIGENWESVLNSYALNIGLPALIFSALYKTSFTFSKETSLILANSIFLVGGFVIAFVIGKVFKLTNKTRKTLFICLAFGNIAYLGIPTLIKISGESVLPQISLIITIPFWTSIL